MDFSDSLHLLSPRTLLPAENVDSDAIVDVGIVSKSFVILETRGNLIAVQDYHFNISKLSISGLLKVNSHFK